MYRIVQSSPSPQKIRRRLPLAALDRILPDGDIEAVCRRVGHRWRRRKLPPGLLVRSMVHRGLHPDHSIAGMLTELAALSAPQEAAPTDAAWCRARSRLPEAVLADLIARCARRCRRQFGRPFRWHERWVFRADGSTVSMPDEPALVEAFGYADTRHGPSRFPVARVTFLELAGANLIWDYRLGHYTDSEEAQFYGLWGSLPGGSIVLLDRKFCSFYILAKLRRRHVDVITPLHQRRDPHRLIAKGRPLGPEEWLVPLDLCPSLRRRFNDPALPKSLWVRLIRVTYRRGSKKVVLWLVTTLMDAQEYPRQEVAAFYRRRWPIETRIGQLKTLLEMNVLRGKSPKAVRREVASLILGHNLIWRLLHEAAQVSGTPAEIISFAGAVKAALDFSPHLRHCPRPQRAAVYHAMLLHIARQKDHHAADRVEPRLIKREHARYAYLREPRWKARQRCLC